MRLTFRLHTPNGSGPLATCDTLERAERIARAESAVELEVAIFDHSDKEAPEMRRVYRGGALVWRG